MSTPVISTPDLTVLTRQQGDILTGLVTDFTKLLQFSYSTV